MTVRKTLNRDRLELEISEPFGLLGYETEVWEAMGWLEELKGSAMINGCEIDFRHPALSNEAWKVIGLCMTVHGNPSSYQGVWLGYSHPDALGDWPRMSGGTPKPGPGLSLVHGDALSIEDVQIEESSDPTLNPIDRVRATASIIVRRQGKSGETLPVRLTYALPQAIVGPTAGRLLSADYANLIARFELLQSQATQAHEDVASILRERLGEAGRHIERLRECIAEITRYTPTDIEGRWLSAQIYMSQNAAASFGYALAIAEAEAGARHIAKRELGNRGKGGRSRAEQIQRAAQAWKERALPVTIKLDRAHPKWTRSRLATEIAQHFDWETPSQATIVMWLKNEAEQPNGPVKSRARKTSSAS